MGFAVWIEMGTHTVAMVTHVSVFVDMESVECIFFESGEVDVDAYFMTRLFGKGDDSLDFLFTKYGNGANGYCCRFGHFYVYMNGTVYIFVYFFAWGNR